MKERNLVEPLAGWPNAGRVVWLTGGIVAYNNPGAEVEICAGSNGPAIRTFKINSYGSLFEILKKMGLSIIGTTFVVHQDELRGLRPAEFRMASYGNGWPLSNLRQKWREIAFAASKQDQMPLMDVTSRLAFGLEYSQLRLYDLVSSYAVQLRARFDKDKRIEYQRFKDLNSREIYKSIHGLFWELAVLRDTLAEFAATFCFSQLGIRTLRGLLRFLKTASSPDSLCAELLSAADEKQGGWLAKFGSYRNFFTHVAPMEWAGGIAFSIQDVRTLNDQSMVPQIYYPLPGDIEKLTHERSNGSFYPTMESLLEASKRKPDRSADPDALDYLHFSLNQFADLATTLLGRSPLPPAPMDFGPEDIIGEIQWIPGSSE
jgi:hypothetical protein